MFRCKCLVQTPIPEFSQASPAMHLPCMGITLVIEISARFVLSQIANEIAARSV
jgi:hypothetical protein